MKKGILVALLTVLVLGWSGLALAADDVLAGEKAWKAELQKVIPKDRILNVKQFKALYDKVMAGEEKAYLIDVRTHPEFYAGHIPGTDHIHSGHVYTIPKKIKDPNAKIVVFCRTSHRSAYVAGMLIRYGYKNVWCYNEGILGWIKAGYPLANQFMGKFKVVEYHKQFTGDKDPYRIREFHPY